MTAHRARRLHPHRGGYRVPSIVVLVVALAIVEVLVIGGYALWGAVGVVAP